MKQTTRMRVLVAVMAPLLALGIGACSKSNKPDEIRKQAPLAERLQNANTAVKDSKATINAAENEISRVSGLPKSKQGPLVRYGEECATEKNELQKKIDALEAAKKALDLEFSLRMTECKIGIKGLGNAIERVVDISGKLADENKALKAEIERLKAAQPKPECPPCKTGCGGIGSETGC